MLAMTMSKLSLRQTVGQVELCIDVVLCGVVFAGADGLFVNIDADGGASAELEGGVVRMPEPQP